MSLQLSRAPWLTRRSLGGALTDTLDMLITERRIEPQLAMKILINFDKAVADVLSDKVKSRLTFKVGFQLTHWKYETLTRSSRGISIHIDSATMSGPLLSRILTSNSTTRTKSTPIGSRLSAVTRNGLARPKAKHRLYLCLPLRKREQASRQGPIALMRTLM